MYSKLHRYGDEELHVLCVLKGSRGFFSELLRVLNRIHRYTDHHVNAPFFEHYVRTAADGSERVTLVDAKASGRASAMRPADAPASLPLVDLEQIRGKHVLVIEDQIQTGGTLKKVCGELARLDPKSVKIAALVDHRSPETMKNMDADFVGFVAPPDSVLVGFCLDYNERYRDLEHICALTPAAVEKYKQK